MPFLLGLDMGTTVLKAILIDTEGYVVAWLERAVLWIPHTRGLPSAI